MNTEALVGRKDDGNGITTLVLNRAPVNALSAGLLQAVAERLDELADDNSVRAVILASPFKVFSAGLDLKEAQAFDLGDQHAIVKGLNVTFTKLYGFPKPVVVAATGSAIAGGLFFLLAADYCVLDRAAKFGLAEVRAGADFPVGPLEIARATLSAADARRLMLGGKPIGADAALDAGIGDAIAEEGDVMAWAQRVAQDYATIPPKTYAAVKQQLRAPTITIIEQAMQQGANAPEGGWFSSESKQAMADMIASRGG